MITTIEPPALPRLSADTLRQLYALPAAERKALGTLLLDSVETPPADPVEYRRAVKDELEYRIRELEAGRIKCLTMEEAMASLRDDSDEELP